jgi:hypothetical protein
VGEGATIMGCPAGVPGPVGDPLRFGFVVNVAASGTSIRSFIFDGKGISDTNQEPLALGITSQFFTNNVTVDSNRFLGGLGGIQGPNGNGWIVSNRPIHRQPVRLQHLHGSGPARKFLICQLH